MWGCFTWAVELLNSDSINIIKIQGVNNDPLKELFRGLRKKLAVLSQRDSLGMRRQTNIAETVIMTSKMMKRV
jgi:hypothetical protein